MYFNERSVESRSKFFNASVPHCFRNSSLTIIWDNLGLSNYKRMKKDLEFREKETCFKKHLLINVQQNILPRTMKWLKDATNALEQEDFQDPFSYVYNWTDPNYSKW